MWGDGDGGRSGGGDDPSPLSFPHREVHTQGLQNRLLRAEFIQVSQCHPRRALALLRKLELASPGHGAFCRLTQGSNSHRSLRGCDRARQTTAVAASLLGSFPLRVVKSENHYMLHPSLVTEN